VAQVSLLRPGFLADEQFVRDAQWQGLKSLRENSALSQGATITGLRKSSVLYQGTTLVGP